VLKGLRVQTFTDFEVLLVLRPNDTETVEVAKHFSKYLNIKIVFQKHRGLLEAYNEGINNVNGDVILFLDDDAVPEPNCIREHLLTYERNNVSGVSGDVIPAYLENGIVKPRENVSEVVAYYKEAALLQYFGHKFWNRPLEGQENYLAYISKAGYSKKNIHLVHNEISNSLLCMAANMSVLTSALKVFRIPTSFLNVEFLLSKLLAGTCGKTGIKWFLTLEPKYIILNMDRP
jgi:glycosyltransferase involved in cell wall biosynthesis